MSDSNRPTNTVTTTVANRVDEVGRVAQLVREFGVAHGLQTETVHDLCVAFDEVLSNIVKYAYKDEMRHEISVRLELAGPNLVAEVVDDGGPFDPLTAPTPPLHGGTDERPIGGLGIYFVRKLMDEVSYARHEGRNVLTMIKRIPRPAGA